VGSAARPQRAPGHGNGGGPHTPLAGAAAVARRAVAGGGCARPPSALGRPQLVPPGTLAAAAAMASPGGSAASPAAGTPGSAAGRSQPGRPLRPMAAGQEVADVSFWERGPAYLQVRQTGRQGPARLGAAGGAPAAAGRLLPCRPALARSQPARCAQHSRAAQVRRAAGAPPPVPPPRPLPLPPHTLARPVPHHSCSRPPGTPPPVAPPTGVRALRVAGGHVRVRRLVQPLGPRRAVRAVPRQEGAQLPALRRALGPHARHHAAAVAGAGAAAGARAGAGGG
jgi:hypothetical protein